MYSGTLGRVNALEFRDASPTKAQVTPKTSPLRSPLAAAPVAPASSDAIQKAFEKMKEVARGSTACAGFTEADLLACLNIAQSPAKPMAAKEPDPEPKGDEQTLLLNALLSSLAKLNTDTSRTPDAHEEEFEDDDDEYAPPQQYPSLVTPPPSPVSAKPSPIKRSPSSLGRIQESIHEDMDSPRSVADLDENEEAILPIHEVKRCLRGGSFGSRIRVRRQPSLKELDAKRVTEVVEKLNRNSIVQLTTPRRLSVVDPKTRSLSRVNSMDELQPPVSPMPLSRKPSLVSHSSPRSLSRQSSSVSFAPPPPPIAVTEPPHAAALRKKKKKPQNQARMSTLASHIKKLLVRSDKTKRSKVLLDASTRVSNMRLGSSPKKCKVKHEELMAFTRPNCRPRRWVPKAGQPLLERQQSYVSLEVMDNIGTRAACPVHLLSEKPTVDFSYVPGVVNSHNRRRRRRSSRRPKLVKRPSLWIVD